MSAHAVRGYYIQLSQRLSATGVGRIGHIPAALLTLALLGSAVWGAVWLRFREPHQAPTIALIPQTGGALLWDVEHFGAKTAAERLRFRLYWNAPTSENDLAGQVTLIDRVNRGKYQGLVLAPDHPLAMLAPVRRVTAAGIPVVVVSADLDLPAGPNLGYIVNDQAKMGELAAAELGRLLHGKGSVALVGANRNAPGALGRERSAEALLAAQFPGISVVSRRGGPYNLSFAEDLTNQLLNAHPNLSGILAFTAISTRGVHTALKNRRLSTSVRLVGCEQDTDLLEYVASGEIAGIVAENTYQMGYQAIESIAGRLSGRVLPARSVVAPLLITKQNLNSAEVNPFRETSR